MITDSVSALEMRRKFGSLLDRVALKGRHITILRGEKPLAVLIPAQEYEEKFQKADRLKTVAKVLLEIDEWNKKKAGKMGESLQRAGQDAESAVREMRDSR